MDLISKAKNIAIKYHKGAIRKSEKDLPYIVHPFDAARIVSKVTDDENIICACYLHDTVEDTSLSLDEIHDLFNLDIKSLVSGATEKDKSKSWEERKQERIDLEKDYDERHKLVILADKISNLSDLRNLFYMNGKRDFSLFNRGYDKQKWFYEETYKALSYNLGSDHPLLIELKELIEEVFSDEDISEVDKPLYYLLELSKLTRTLEEDLILNVNDNFDKEYFEEFLNIKYDKDGLDLTRLNDKLEICKEIRKDVVKRLNDKYM